MPNPYSATLIDHFRTPHNRGSLRDPTIAEEGANPLCGDRVRIELLVEGDAVRDVKFTANACAICVASVSMLTDLVLHAPLDEVETLTVEDLLRSLQADIPGPRLNCVRLPLTVLHTGVHLYRRRQRPASPKVIARRQGSVAAVVLAAGRARRFGGQKLLAPWGTSTVIRMVVERVRAAPVKDIVVVVRDTGEGVRGALVGIDVAWAVNTNPERGMSSSIGVGIEAVPPNAAAAVVVLGDQPTVDSDVIARLMDVWRTGDHSIVAPWYRGKRGNPVLFDRELFDALRTLEGDRGARDFLDANPSRIRAVDIDEPPPLDIDTPADYESLFRGAV